MKLDICQKSYLKDIEKLYGDCVLNIDEVLKIGKEVLPLIKFKKRSDNLSDIRTQQILSLFKEILERIDGILILIKSKSGLNARIILRAFLEIIFDLRIILNDSSDKSAVDYVYFKYGDYIIKLETYNINPIIIKQEWDSLDRFATAYSFQCLKPTHEQNIKSYCSQWFDYNKNVISTYRDNDEKKYYGNLCMEVHGQNSVRDNVLKKNGIFSLKSLRCPENVGTVFYTIIHYFSQVTFLILAQYVNDSEKVKEIKDKLDALEDIGIKLNDEGILLMENISIEEIDLS